MLANGQMYLIWNFGSVPWYGGDLFLFNQRAFRLSFCKNLLRALHSLLSGAALIGLPARPEQFL